MNTRASASLLAATLAGCTAGMTPVLLPSIGIAVSKSSPAQLGVGGRVGVPVVSVGPATAVAVGAYEYSRWDGGHDDVFSFGMQMRGRTGVSSKGGILGFEGLYHRWVCRSESTAECGDSPAANGVGFNGIVMKPLAGDRVRLWASAGPTWLSSFRSNGAVAFEGGFGWHAHVGVELPIGGR